MDTESYEPDQATNDIRIQLLAEYLSSESGGVNEQSLSSQISRLVIAGNSLIPADPVLDQDNLNLVPTMLDPSTTD